MARPVLRGVVFDMDGTLTVPNLDFALMYKRCNVPMSEDILKAVDRMPKEEKHAAWRVIDAMEEEGRRTLQLKRGTVEIARWLGQHNLRTAVVTRNSSATLQHFSAGIWRQAGLPPFSVAISRDDDVPAKPDPAALRIISDQWGVPLSPDLLMVGDSPSNDVRFGKAAGVSTALLHSGRGRLEEGEDGGADFCVDNLFQLPGLLWKHFDIEGDLGGALKKHATPTPSTPATRAAAAGDVRALQALPTPHLDLPDESGNTPLIWAADRGHADAVAALLSANVQVNVRGFLGATALCRASRAGHLDVMKKLLQAPGIDCDISNDKMQYPLHFAAFKLQPEAVNLLLEKGANTLVLDRKGRTPAEDTSDNGIRDAILSARGRLDQEAFV
eukprot:CAMPEP_0114236660 /NCGR_PEP_ID=MMETSP0058-20121206/6964_1 /TAXON_ID=36894 /ORGANISM="Pyramimonas parkeae, CCMP726" /LENGTH=385 /DNA_ID=CAMNT_0001348627 /DNA_START=186 /DNA_END=1343 /DNA_ORIENTATION=-